MDVKTLVLVVGLLVYVGVFTHGYWSARRREQSWWEHRIGIRDFTRWLDLLFLPLSLLWVWLFVCSLVFPFPDNDEWLFPPLALANALLVGFPKGVLSPPGLVSEGLVLMGHLYRWDFFSGYEVKESTKIWLAYRKPWLGFRGQTVRIRPEDQERFVARLEENGLLMGTVRKESPWN